MSKRELGVFAALIVLVAAVTTHATLYTVFSIVVAGLLFQILVRRNKKVLLVVGGSIVGYILFEAAGSWLLERRTGEYHGTDIDHRMKPTRRGVNPDGVRSNP